ncbi:MAG: hypothetical protein ACXWP6_16575, partial [Ktedonobacterales bacterium]
MLEAVTKHERDELTHLHGQESSHSIASTQAYSFAGNSAILVRDDNRPAQIGRGQNRLVSRPVKELPLASTLYHHFAQWHL